MGHLWGAGPRAEGSADSVVWQSCFCHPCRTDKEARLDIR